MLQSQIFASKISLMFGLIDTLSDQKTTQSTYAGAINSIVFGLIGIILFIGGYFLFDLLTTKLDIQKELSKGNIAVGIVVAALMISIALVIASVVH